MKKRKVLIIVAIVFISIIVGFLAYREWAKYNNDGSNEWEKLDYLINDVDCKMYICGESIKMDDQFEYDKLIESAKIEDLAKLDMNHDYVYFIISDLGSSLHMTEEQVKSVVEKAKSDSNFYFYYLGTDALELFDKHLGGDTLTDSNDKSIGYDIVGGNKICSGGMYTTDDEAYMEKNPYLLAENIIDIIAKHIGWNEDNTTK